MVRHRHDLDRQRYASYNFPVNKRQPVEMKDNKNPNLLESVRKRSSSSTKAISGFAKTSRLSVPNKLSLNEMAANWKRNDPKANDLPNQDNERMLNSKNNFDLFIRTNSSPNAVLASS